MVGRRQKPNQLNRVVTEDDAKGLAQHRESMGCPEGQRIWVTSGSSLREEPSLQGPEAGPHWSERGSDVTETKGPPEFMGLPLEKGCADTSSSAVGWGLPRRQDEV